MNSTALITGASSGIGREAAIALSRAGHTVLIGYNHNRRGAEETASEVKRLAPDLCACVYLPMSEPVEVESHVDRILKKYGPVDILVNNAGVNRRREFLRESLDEWRAILDVNLTSPFMLAQLVAGGMVTHQIAGRIVNVTSVHQYMPITGGTSYAVSKAGLSMLTQSMALELGQYGITVNSVAPGETATPMNGVESSVDPATIQRPAIPAGRPANPSEVGDLISYLCSPNSSYITGQTFVIDGGLSLIAADANVQKSV